MSADDAYRQQLAAQRSVADHNAAQEERIRELSASVEMLTMELSAEVEEHKHTEARATTAESSLETARGALEQTRKVLNSHNEWSNPSCGYNFRDTLQTISVALAALPSPPITKIKGEG